MNAAALVLAVPSKGRLQENAAAFFSRAGRAKPKPAPPALRDEVSEAAE